MAGALLSFFWAVIILLGAMAAGAFVLGVRGRL